MNWDQYFYNLCIEVSKKSKDDSTQVGCVIVGPDKEIRSTGYNGLPRGVIDNKDTVIQLHKKRYERPEKYLWTEHAERNAIYNAARCGIALKECSIYIFASNSISICADCARAIIQSGIKEIIINHTDNIDDRWKDSCFVSQQMLKEADVKIREFKLC